MGLKLHNSLTNKIEDFKPLNPDIVTMYACMKEFDLWNEKKKLTERKQERPEFKQRDIFFARLGENVGFEQSGKGGDFLRPVLVFRKFSNEVFWGIPLTKTLKKTIFYFHFSFVEGVDSVAILSQLKLVDSKRLERKIGVMEKENFSKLKESVRALMG